jgi:hypothetical protein
MISGMENFRNSTAQSPFFEFSLTAPINPNYHNHEVSTLTVLPVMGKLL